MRIFNMSVIFSLMIILSSSLSHAQAVKQTPMPAKMPQNKASISTPDDIDKEMTVMRDEYAGKYALSNLENLSKLYWRLGAFDFEDEDSILNYIKINDCKIYQDFARDDFEWRKIMTSMKNYLKKSYQSFPLSYQFTVKMNLGKYDLAKGGFEVINDTGFRDSKLINVESVDYRNEVCNDNTISKSYPKSVITLLNKSFALNLIKADEHVAQAYILRNKKSSERIAYLRLRIKFSQYIGNLRSENDGVFAVLNGDIDGYEVFEDSGQKNLMLSVDMQKEDAVQTGAYSTPILPKQNQATAPIVGAISAGFASSPQ